MHVQMGIDADVKGGQGRFACLLAQSFEAEDNSSFGKPLLGLPGANVPPFFRFLLSEHLQVMLAPFPRQHPNNLPPPSPLEYSSALRSYCLA